ncbi:sensor histidine kinase [Streptomyces sp. NPDC059875]|uniref:sensor histidine kinase n=1 Tax=unclassified Streptomyces TaxID=2593676 RepID=UPI00365C23F7
MRRPGSRGDTGLRPPWFRTPALRDDRRSRPRRLPLRKSLLGRLLAVSVLVAACSVAATAWLAAQTTSGAIKQEQGQNLAADTRIYQTLLAYAASHPEWDGVAAPLRDLAAESGRRVVLTTPHRQIIADSAAHGPAPELPVRASAVVDPLSVDTTVSPNPTGPSTLVGGTAGDSAGDRIDPRAVGPFRLPPAERARLKRAADDAAGCLHRYGIASDIVLGPSGRPRLHVIGNEPDQIHDTGCATSALDEPTPTEKTALSALSKLVDACLARQGKKSVPITLDLSRRTGSALPVPVLVPVPVPGRDRAAVATPAPAAPGTPRAGGDDRAVASCLETARREQLSTYVAAPALLFIGDTADGTVPGIDLSPANTARIVGAATIVLALTVGVSVFAGVRFVRPLHALTGAAQRMRDGENTEAVRVTADNEIGRLAAAFNDMTAHRARLEEQRKALTSDIAHELRTPLSNIRGWLEAAQDGLADPDTAFVSSLLEEALQLQHIIDDLQDLAAADAGALRLHTRPGVRIEELLIQVSAAHQARAEAAKVTLSVRPAKPGSPALTVTADPVRLRQAVGNLVANAVRHTPAGGRVTLRAYPVDDDRRQVAVDVADTGTGIAPEDLRHVFERFWRAEKSRSRRTGGSGLGLAIVRKLVEAHGGTVHAVSAIGEGSVFILRLPGEPTSTTDGQGT